MEAKFKAFCRLCWDRCPIEVTVSNGKVVKVRGDKEFVSRRRTLCAKGVAVPEILNHPQRLKYPQKRQGEKGEGKWGRISWDEALSLIAEKMSNFKANFGAESVVIGLSDPKGLDMPFAQRLASVFGTPNVATSGHVCHVPGELASIFTYGSACFPDSDKQPNCLVIWGNNLADTHSSNSISWLRFRSLRHKTKLIAIDPRKTALASQANIWLKPRPGSDGALALGMLKVIIEEGLFNKEFVANWTFGFEELKKHLENYSLGRIEEVTWVSKEQIKETARLYASVKPAAIQWGNALDSTINSFQTCRAISILRAISGNLDVPGGDLIAPRLPITSPGRFMLLPEFPRKSERSLSPEFRLAIRSAFIPREPVSISLIEGKPYPVRMALLLGTNPLLTFADARKTYDALLKLEFLVATELFMTPTAELADIVLPAATNLEFDEIGPYPPFFGPFILAHPKVVEPPGECWSDIKIINELAKKLGLGEYFWNDEKDSLDLILKPSQLTFEEFKGKRILQAETGYRKYQKTGFRTPSGKVELYSKQLEELGYSPLPIFVDSPKTELTEQYPLALTNAKASPFFHSAYRNIPKLRRLSPEPIVELNPSTATKLGLKQGDWVHIETKRGKIKQKLSLNNDLDSRVVVAAYGWWFPEKGSSQLYGWDESNINILTDSQPPYEPALGSVNLRGIPCKVYKVCPEDKSLNQILEKIS